MVQAAKQSVRQRLSGSSVYRQIEEGVVVKTVDPASLSLSVSVLLCVTMTTPNLFRFINKHWRMRSRGRLVQPMGSKELQTWELYILNNQFV